MFNEREAHMRVSVVIPAYNESAHIAKTLAALGAQTLPRAEFEIVLVDNGSSDGTVRLAEAFATSLPLRIVSLPKRSISAVRNHGVRLTAGGILAFLDADCVPEPSWLERSVDLAPPNSVWGAHYLVPLEGTWVGKVWFRYQATEREGPVSFLPGGDLFLRRKDFDRIGGFSESLETSEDVELCSRARESGMEVLAFPSLGVFHEGTPRTLRGFYRQNRWHGKHVLRSFLDNFPSTRNLPLIALSFYTFALFWAALIVPFFAISGRHWLLAVAPLLLLPVPAAVISLAKTVKAGSLGQWPQLAVLYLTYFLARAAALSHIAPRKHR